MYKLHTVTDARCLLKIIYSSLAAEVRGRRITSKNRGTPVLIVHKPECGMRRRRSSPQGLPPPRPVPPRGGPLARCHSAARPGLERWPRGPLLRGACPAPPPCARGRVVPRGARGAGSQRRGCPAAASLALPAAPGAPTRGRPLEGARRGRAVRGAEARGPPGLPAAGPPPPRGGAGLGGAAVRHRKEGRRPEVPSQRAAALTDLIKRKEARDAAEPSCRLPKLTTVCSCRGRLPPREPQRGSLRPLLAILELHPTGERTARKGKANASCSARW